MSTQAQHGMGGQNMWDHTQFSFRQSIQLEEHPYALDSTSTTSHFPQQRHISPSSLNPPPSVGRYNSLPSAVPFASSSGFVSPPLMQTSSFNSLDGDVDLTLDTSSSSFGAAPHPARVSPVYTQQNLNPLEPNQVSEGSPNHATPQSYLPPGPMQFSPPLPLPPRQSELQAQYFNTLHVRTQQDFPPNLKRPKTNADHDDGQGEQLDAQAPAPAQDRPKSAGACARCKSLKVRCEFRDDSDTCKRCTSAGQECVIPGRKPRRAPPKREHLLSQIREQAKQIQELMANIEALNRPAIAQAQSPHSPASALHSPMESNSESVVPNAEMQDWISRARISIQEFGGLIPAGDPADADDDYLSDEAAEEYSDDESGYATAEDDASRDVASPASSTAKRQLSQTTQLKMLPGEDAPYGLIAALAIRKSARERSVEPESSDAVGVANADFFRPNPGPDSKHMNPSSTGVQLPPILARGIVSIKEADRLFGIYFDKMNISANLLDPALHTPQYVAMRSPFLFTIICGIASRFYGPRPDLYQQLIRYRQLAAGTALISGTKNEEMSAAYLLMQLYPVPAKRWNEERSWVYLGVAIRVAQDINLNRPVTTKPLNEQNARILLSRQRIWMSCFNLDRSTGTQYGKRSIIPNTDYFASHSEDWWKSSPYNMKGFDIHLCGYNAELRLINGFTAKIYGDPSHPIGLDKSLNVAQLASDTDDALRQLGERWFKRLDEFEEQKTEMWAFRTELLRMIYAYSRLIALSTGLKHAKGGQLDENTFIQRCLDAASEIVNAFVRRLFPTAERKILLRHAPDAQFVFVTFACAFLVKLLQPKYSRYFTYERRQEIRTLVQEAVDLLGAPEVVVDDKHGPKLFSRFLAGLLATQNVNPDTLSPISKSSHLRRTGSRSKVPSGKGREWSGPSSPFYGAGPELVSPSNFTDSSSPARQYVPLDGNSRGHSPSTVDLGLELHAYDINQGTAMPVDQELLDSMQFLSDPVWQDMSVPGFHWINQLNTGSSSTLNTNDYALYEQQQYGMPF
ncbi:hypothetical protein JVT61DRAFT_4508 [Boletus reticuloceps]|uniref:Zn(2)-C6 fungal-type domain-containing protein n=1 Tax=Boletus reticuloceps TaxID=495285 RepID=A0A8I3A9F0_9AGAM|nr:hypothetical protein JVT61DRAFT_4508 [Boletus reticuloceps]